MRKSTRRRNPNQKLTLKLQVNQVDRKKLENRILMFLLQVLQLLVAITIIRQRKKNQQLWILNQKKRKMKILLSIKKEQIKVDKNRLNNLVMWVPRLEERASQVEEEPKKKVKVMEEASTKKMLMRK